MLLLETICADKSSVITVGAPNAGKINDIYERVFLPILTKNAAKCGCNVCIELTETAREEILKRLCSLTAWSAMYSAVEEIVLAVIAERPDGGAEQAVIGYDGGRFRAEGKRLLPQDVETRE